MPSLRQTARYRFDNWMSRGTGAQILLLTLLTIALVLITALALRVYGGAVPTYAPDPNNPDQTVLVHTDETFGKDVWRATMHAMDPGTISGDQGAPDNEWSWSFLAIMLF